MKLLLPALSLSVLYTIFHYAQTNNLAELAKASIEAKHLPGTDIPLRTTYTGIEPVDHLLTILTVFFWPTTDGSNPSLLLHSIAFSGTFGSAWVLVTLEAWRRGNRGSIAGFPIIFGLTAQILTFAFATPLYCFFQLTNSPAYNPTPQNLRIPRPILKSVPLVFLIGYILPTQLLITPLSEIITADRKQLLIAIWQPWPAYVSILLSTIHTIHTFFEPKSPTTDPKQEKEDRSSLRWIYALTFGHTALAHVITWTISLATLAVPGIFNQTVVRELHPGNVFEVPLPWDGRVVNSVGEGVHCFLRWDYIIGSLGVLLWAGIVHSRAVRVGGGLGGWFWLKVALLGVFAGPVGAAVWLVWERDELFSSSGSSSGSSGSGSGSGSGKRG
ncbi:hypothetical protein BDV25DRAFT_138016 [Aspergillus avenaceus]|uniref:AtmA protein n=1 Tax=Aspergillus avenaceus TaxID=36643 RepID=A0A5N6U110_ASPAV|nr:hypothetical protein BDV25DRAFT_138016 [Aspergillus avenaceus]